MAVHARLAFKIDILILLLWRSIDIIRATYKLPERELAGLVSVMSAYPAIFCQNAFLPLMSVNLKSNRSFFIRTVFLVYSVLILLTHLLYVF